MPIDRSEAATEPRRQRDIQPLQFHRAVWAAVVYRIALVAHVHAGHVCAERSEYGRSALHADDRAFRGSGAFEPSALRLGDVGSVRPGAAQDCEGITGFAKDARKRPSLTGRSSFCTGLDGNGFTQESSRSYRATSPPTQAIWLRGALCVAARRHVLHARISASQWERRRSSARCSTLASRLRCPRGHPRSVAGT